MDRDSAHDRRTASKAFRIVCERPILAALFDAPQSVLGWSLNRPGFRTTRAVVWREVRNADLPIDADPRALLEGWLAEAGYADAVGLLTSRDVTWRHAADAVRGDVVGSCLATVGLGNAGRIGRQLEPAATGTINILAHVSKPLGEAALIEAISIVAQARTAAILELGLRRGGEVVTGTGTDCIVVAAPEGEPRERFAGMHTPVGEALGAAVFEATLAGGRRWMEEHADD